VRPAGATVRRDVQDRGGDKKHGGGQPQPATDSGQGESQGVDDSAVQDGVRETPPAHREVNDQHRLKQQGRSAVEPVKAR
jgi:hypothetical protein